MIGKFVVIDGLTGSGKSTIIRAMKAAIADSGRTIFDLEAWSLENREAPSFHDAKGFDVLFTFEPTKTWIGSAIRKEMSRVDNPYSAQALAQAFALDRLIMYRRLIIPALAAGKIVIQDRSFSSSIIIQVNQRPQTITLDELLALEGNKLALEHAPNALVLTTIRPEVAAQRAVSRQDSKGVFEDPELLKRMAETVAAPWFAKLFTDRGTIIHRIDADISKEEMELNAKKFIIDLIENKL